MASDSRKTYITITFMLSALIFSLLIWPSYGEIKFSGIPNLAPSRLLKFLTLVCIFIFLDKSSLDRFYFILQKEWIVFSLFISYFLMRILTLAFDDNSFYYIYSFVKEEVFTNILILLFILLIIKDVDGVKICLKAFVIAAIVVFIMVLFEYIAKKNIFSLILSADANLGADFAFMDKSRDNVYRAQGPFSHPLILAQFCCCSLPILFSVQRFTTGIKKILVMISILLCVITAFLTNTRSGEAIMVLSFILILSRYFISWWKTCRDSLVKIICLWHIFFISVFVFILLSVWMSDLMYGRSYEESHSSFARLDMIASAVPKILASPLFGYGPTHALDGVGFYSRYGRFIDNYFLLISLQSGVFSAFILMLTIFYFCKDYFSHFSFVESEYQSILTSLSTSVIIFFLFQIIHASSEPLYFFYIFAGFIFVIRSLVKNKIEA